MAVVEDKLHDELLPELEFHVMPSKLSDNVRVDLGTFNDVFMNYLVTIGCIKDDVHNDCHIMPVTKFPKFCKEIRDAFRTYNMSQNAHV